MDEIHVQDLACIRYDSANLHLYTKDERMFVLTVPKATGIIEMLIQKDWVEARPL